MTTSSVTSFRLGKESERDPLLLPSRELVRIAAAETRKSNQVEELFAARPSDALGRPPDPQAELEIFRNSHVPENRVVLMPRS